MMVNEQLFLVKLGLRLKELRKKNGFGSQENFANICDLSRTQYSRYENGMNLTMLLLFKILKVHKITLEEFFSEGFEEIDTFIKQ